MPCKGPFLDSAKRGVSAETKKFQAFKKDLPRKTASEKSRFICTQSKGDIFHHRLRKPKMKNKSQFPSFPSPYFASRKELKREGGTKQGKSKKPSKIQYLEKGQQKFYHSQPCRVPSFGKLTVPKGRQQQCNLLRSIPFTQHTEIKKCQVVLFRRGRVPNGKNSAPILWI